MKKDDPKREPTTEELEDINAHWGDIDDPSLREAKPTTAPELQAVPESEVEPEPAQESEPESEPEVEPEVETKVEPKPQPRAEKVDFFNDTTPMPTKRASSGKRRWPLILLVVVLVLAIAGGAYYWFGVRKSTKPAATEQADRTTAQTETAPVATTTKHYDSSNYNLGFDYPETWKLTDNELKLTVVSPSMSFTDAVGKEATGHIVVTIRNRQTTLPEFATGAATAVLDSEKIAYTKPTQNQRAQTYLTFLKYGGTKIEALDAVYITGDNGYKVGQSVPQSDVIQTEPLITVSFVSCATEDCATGTPTMLHVSTATWSKETVSKPVTVILTSLTIN